MKLSPLEIKKQEFARSFRGYDVEEVQAFLQMVAGQWESLMEQNRRLEEQVTELEHKIEHYEKVEEALQDALETARENAQQKLENAEEKADQLVREAEMKAERIREEAQDERYAIRREVSELQHRRQEIVTRLRAFLMSEMEMLAEYEGDDPIGFIKLLPQGDPTEASVDEMEEDLPSAREYLDEKRDDRDRGHEADPDRLEPDSTGSDADSFEPEGSGPQREDVPSSDEGPSRGAEEEDRPEDAPRWRVHSVVSESREHADGAGAAAGDGSDGGTGGSSPREESGSSHEGSAHASSGPGTDPTEELSSEEMEKIRRILDDLE